MFAKTISKERGSMEKKARHSRRQKETVDYQRFFYDVVSLESPVAAVTKRQESMYPTP